MKKILPIIFVIVVIIFAQISPLLFSSGSNLYLPIPDEGYVIEDYKVDINISENKDMLITETITANMLESSRGIVRYLPTHQGVTYYDAEGNEIVKNYKNSIKDFTILETASSIEHDFYLVNQEDSNGYRFFYVGSDTRFVGTATFKFSYVFNSGDDRDPSKDLFYFNIIGTGWDTNINNVDFSVTFPTEIEEQEFKFYVGRYGNDGGSERITFSKSGKTLTGNCNGLIYGEAITTYSEFEDGYFKVEKNIKIDIFILVVFLCILIGLIIFFIIKRRKVPVTEVVEFKAPDGLTPTEVGFINDGKITGDDLSALIVYWASKGYVKLVENGETFDIVKIADLPKEAKTHEKILFKEMFIGRRETINSSELDDLDIEVGYKCKNSIEIHKDRYFNTKIDLLYNIFVYCSIFVYSLLIYLMVSKCLMIGTPLIILVVMIAILTIALLCISPLTKLKEKIKPKTFKILLGIELFFIIGTIITISVFLDPYCDVFFARIYAMILPIALCIIYPLLERYNKNGRSKLGQIRGLKNYILLAEKDQMEALVNEYPERFYEVLPFAYVLGVSDVYMEKFKDIEIINPEWLIVSSSYSWQYRIRRINTNINVMSNTFTKKMVANTISKSIKSAGGAFSGGGGGFGGGGSSGGGSGGGGGGRF